MKRRMSSLCVRAPSSPSANPRRARARRDRTSAVPRTAVPFEQVDELAPTPRRRRAGRYDRSLGDSWLESSANPANASNSDACSASGPSAGARAR
jgi:hypothetical protein